MYEILNMCGILKCALDNFADRYGLYVADDRNYKDNSIDLFIFQKAEVSLYSADDPMTFKRTVTGLKLSQAASIPKLAFEIMKEANNHFKQIEAKESLLNEGWGAGDMPVFGVDGNGNIQQASFKSEMEVKEDLWNSMMGLDTAIPKPDVIVVEGPKPTSEQLQGDKDRAIRLYKQLKSEEHYSPEELSKHWEVISLRGNESMRYGPEPIDAEEKDEEVIAATKRMRELWASPSAGRFFDSFPTEKELMEKYRAENPEEGKEDPMEVIRRMCK